ncbi:MAG: hypothetical protein J7L47_00640, partial [Candidatus Odinarchaeota archaeon]|nr:hypothetical protein [Candidatus Odinarchaeota archaeon]
IAMSISMLDKVKSELKKFGIKNLGVADELTTSLITSLLTLGGVKIVSDIAKGLGDKARSVISKISEYMGSYEKIFFSNAKDKVRQLWKLSMSLVEALKGEALALFNAVLYYLINFFSFFFLLQFGEKLVSYGIPLTEGTVNDLESSIATSVLFGAMGSFIAYVAESLLDEEIPAEGELREIGRIAKDEMREITDGIFVTILAVDDLTEIGKGNIKLGDGILSRVLKKIGSGIKTATENSKTKSIGEFVASHLQEKHLSYMFLSLLFLGLAVKASRSHDTAWYAKLAALTFAMAQITAKTNVIDVLEHALIELRDKIEEKAKDVSEPGNIMDKARQDISSEKKENKFGLRVQVLGDITAFSLFTASIAVDIDPTMYSWGMFISGIVGLIGDIAHDDKISYFDLMSAFYIGYDGYCLMLQFTGSKHSEA